MKEKDITWKLPFYLAKKKNESYPFNIEARSQRTKGFKMLVHLPSSSPLNSDVRHDLLLILNYITSTVLIYKEEDDHFLPFSTHSSNERGIYTAANNERVRVYFFQGFINAPCRCLVTFFSLIYFPLLFSRSVCISTK